MTTNSTGSEHKKFVNVIVCSRAMAPSAPNDSTKQKLFSLQSIALTAAIIFVVLIFVAGAMGTLHHKDPNLPISCKTLSMQKTEEPTKKYDNQRQPTGSEPLPRGIVQGTSNLEMVSMVGNPEQQKEGAGRPSKSLLAIPVGIKNKATVDKLVSKFPADSFTVMLFHYDGAVEQWGDLAWSDRAVHVSARGQTKWWFAKRFLHPDVVAEYDYVFLWDEDVEVDAFDPLGYLEVVRREGLEVSQPALDHRSEIHHGITARALGADVHRRFYRAASVAGGARCDDGSTGPPCAGWVEVMVPVFSRAAWRCVWGMVQNDLVHGWGLDYKFGHCAQGDRTMKVGVVDSQYVLHRGVPMLVSGGGGKGPSAAGRIAVRRRSFTEMQIFHRRWKKAMQEDESWTDPYGYP